MEVNIPRDCCLVVKAMMEKEYDENLLAEVEKQIVINLSDTYFRFMRSDFYVDYVKKSQLTKEVLEGKMDFSKGVTNTHLKVMLEKTTEIQMEQKRLTEVAEKMKQRENELNSMMQEKDHTISSLEKRLADQRMQIDQLRQDQFSEGCE
jgi:septin family protein